MIVIPAHDLLGAPTYRVSLTKYASKDTPSIPVYPAQRVIRKLSKIKSPKDISDATSTTGVPVFEERQGHYSSASDFLSNFSPMLGSVDRKAAEALLDPESGMAEFKGVNLERDANGRLVQTVDHSDEPWYAKLAQSIAE
jgi:hypothetical protein